MKEYIKNIKNILSIFNYFYFAVYFLSILNLKVRGTSKNFKSKIYQKIPSFDEFFKFLSGFHLKN